MNIHDQSDGYETPERDRAACLGCNGSGSVRVILGDDQELARCEDCGGLGYQLTRDDFANLDALRDDRDLRLVPEAAEDDMPSFRSHAEEIAWHLARRSA